MELTRRRFIQYSTLLTVGALGQALTAGADAASTTPLGPLGALGFPWRARQAGIPDPAVHALSRLSFGHTPAEIAAIQAGSFNLDAWLDQQLSPSSDESPVLNQKLAAFESLGKGITELIATYPQPMQGYTGPTVATVVSEITRAALLRKVYSQWQLKEVLVDFWTDHFNIFIGKELCRWGKTVDDREVIRPHALGNFHAMLFASAHSPAMMNYLDNDENRSQAPNENYAREIMELHTLGVDGGYNQQDVEQLAKCFTGWTVYGYGPRADQTRMGQFYFEPRRHASGNKTVLGNVITGQTGANGIREAEQVIRILADHRSTAKFVAGKLVRRFVSDTPSAALVSRIADVFYAHRSSPTQIAEVMRAIVDSPEFAASYGQKTRRPLDFMPAAMRALEANSSGDNRVVNLLRPMGQGPFTHEFPDGFPDTGPDWMNTNGLLTRWNFALQLVENRLTGTTVSLLPWFDAVRPATPHALVDALTARILGYTIDPADRDALAAYVTNGATYAVNNATIRNIKLPELAALIISSPYFQAR